MRILCAGGGSGGHVTPVAAVMNEILIRYPDAEFTFVCDKAFEEQARGLMKRSVPVDVGVKVISAGKFRRYAHLTFWEHFTVPSVVFGNIRDIARICLGIMQSVFLVLKVRPDVIFAKGGYVCLPVGIASRICRVPLVIHDSDARPGLTNRIIARWATKIATGAPLKNYPYPASRSTYVGVPIAAEFRQYSTQERRNFRQHLGFDPMRPLVVAAGGGLGAASINRACINSKHAFMNANISVMLITGRRHYEEAARSQEEHFKVVPFIYEDMAQVLAAADVVITRASATFMQELAGIGAAVIAIPSRALGDQRKNASVYSEAHAALVMSDDQISESGVLYAEVKGLIESEGARKDLGRKLHAFARPQAAKLTAELIIVAADL